VQPYRQCLPPKVLAIPETFIGDEGNILHSFLIQMRFGRWRLTEAQFSDLTEYFIAFASELDARNEHGQTPLYVSCLHGLYSSFHVLAAKGAEVTAVDGAGRGSLHLLLRGDRVRLGDEKRPTGLQDALIAALMKGCNLNLLSMNATTPSDIARQEGGVGWVQWEKVSDIRCWSWRMAREIRAPSGLWSPSSTVMVQNFQRLT
jgi:hypothetical protein